MGDIPAWFWMFIIFGLSVLLGMIMYHLAMLLRESTLTVREFKYLVIELHDILDSAKIFLERANRIADTVGNVVDTVSNTILKPVATIGMWMKSAQGVMSRFTGQGEEYDDED